MSEPLLDRRGFVGTAVTAIAAPNFVRALGRNSKLNIALVGSGGRGLQTRGNFAGENLVAFVDVDAAAQAKAKEAYPQGQFFDDYRKMFDQVKGLDAVVVSTPEHHHFHPTMLALKAGLHVYCEKPLSYNVAEARAIRLEAAKSKRATQMGNQMHGTDNMRACWERVRSGIIGPVTEAHVWVSRAWGLQSAEAATQNKDLFSTQDSPQGEHAVPQGINWEQWVGPAPHRPFNNVYLPGPKWYRYWNFGNGTMSDLGSHWNDLAFWALQLKAPLTVEAFGPKAHPEVAPASLTVKYEYGARGDLPPVTLTWYQGIDKPAPWKEKKIPQWANGILFVGTKGMILYDYQRHILLPEAEFKDAKAPAPTLPRVQSHFVEWLNACKTGSATLSNFEYAGWLTEANHLGNVAYRVGKKIEWDADAMRVKNAPEAEPLIKREYRDGWRGLV
jgi:predicted dehydrogenase